MAWRPSGDWPRHQGRCLSKEKSWVDWLSSTQAPATTAEAIGRLFGGSVGGSVVMRFCRKMFSNGLRAVSDATNKKITTAAKVKIIGNPKPREMCSRRFCAIRAGIAGAKLTVNPTNTAKLAWIDPRICRGNNSLTYEKLPAP
jgi:hypothetical protein